MNKYAWMAPVLLGVVACSSDGAPVGDASTTGEGTTTGDGSITTGDVAGASGGLTGGDTTATGGDTTGLSGSGGGSSSGGSSNQGSGGSQVGVASGGSGSLGTGGTTGQGTGGGDGEVGPGPSGWPAPDESADLPRPSGTPSDIEVLDWAGFTGAVTYSFDDNTQSQKSEFEGMMALDVPFTFFLVSNWGIDDQVWKDAHAKGHEIANHTTEHKCTTDGIDTATSAITQTFGEAPTTLAAPNGDSACTDQVKGRLFLNRGVGPAQPVQPNGNSNPFQLNCYIPATGQQTAAFNSNIDSALSQGGWVIYVIHGFQGHNDGAYQPVPFDAWKAAVEYAKSKDIWIGTLEDIGAYWLGQKALSSAMTTTAGDAKTWTWQLPDKFPEGKYLRVVVDGGTLTQNGKSVVWDPHGYYEIALDEGTVTVEP